MQQTVSFIELFYFEMCHNRTPTLLRK